MWLPLALTAALLTSFLPIINKRLLADTDVSVVAWGTNLLSLPVLGAFTLALLPLPAVDATFWAAIAASAVVNLAATLLSTQAWKVADASLVTPFLTFNPVFTLAVGWLALGETPHPAGVAGVLLIVAGGYVMNLPEARAGWWRPLVALVRERGIQLALLASLLWGLTPVVEKVAIQHSAPPNPPGVAWLVTALMVLTLSVPAARGKRPLADLARHRRGFGAAAVIAGVAPVFGFTAIATGLVGYVTAMFKLSTVLTVLWAGLLLGEHHQRPRLAGAAVMAAGALLIAL